MTPWSKEEIRTEYQYRIDERLGILSPLREPTEAQLKIAEDEADEWLKMITEASQS